jgi:hypothetical protein
MKTFFWKVSIGSITYIFFIMLQHRSSSPANCQAWSLSKPFPIYEHFDVDFQKPVGFGSVWFCFVRLGSVWLGFVRFGWYDGISWNDISWNDMSWNDMSWNFKKRHLVECHLVERCSRGTTSRWTPISWNLTLIWSRLIYIWPQEEVLVMRVVLTLGDERPAFSAPG